MSMMIRRHRRGKAETTASPEPKKPVEKSVEEEKPTNTTVRRGRPKKEQ